MHTLATDPDLTHLSRCLAAAFRGLPMNHPLNNAGSYPPGCTGPPECDGRFMDDFRLALDVGAKSAARKTAKFDGFLLNDLDIEFIEQTNGKIRCVLSCQCSVDLDADDMRGVDEGMEKLTGTLSHFWSGVE